jgi:hypothetical protein
MSRLLLATLLFLLSTFDCRRAIEPSQTPTPSAAALGVGGTKTGGQAAAAQIATASPDASAVDAGMRSSFGLSPATKGKWVSLDTVGKEGSSLEVLVPSRFKVRIAELTEVQLPSAHLKGPAYQMLIETPEGGLYSLAEEQRMRKGDPTIVFDRAEETADGVLMIFHWPHPLEYEGDLNRPKLEVSCGGRFKSLADAEEGMSICLTLHDRD